MTTSQDGLDSAVATGDYPWNYPTGLALSANGDVIVANTFSHSIWRLSSSGKAAWVAGVGTIGLKNGSSKTASFNYPEGVAVDEFGTIYVADSDNHTIRLIEPTGEVSTLAGCGRGGYRDGFGDHAAFTTPRNVALDREGKLLVADTFCVRRVTADGEVSTLTKRSNWSDSDKSARLGFLGGIAIAENGDIILTDTSLNAVLILERDLRLYCLAGGKGAGFSDGRGAIAKFDKPRGLAIDRSGRIFIADSNNNAVRVLLPNGQVDTLRGEDLGIENGFYHPAGIAIGREGYLYVSDPFNNCVHKVLV